MGHPDIPGAQCTAQVPQGAQFIIAAADTAVRITHVRSPGVRDQAHGRVAGHGTPGRGTIERPDHLDGWQHRVVRGVGGQGEGLQKRRWTLPGSAISGPKEVDGVIEGVSDLLIWYPPLEDECDQFVWGYRDHPSAALSLLPRYGYCATWHDV